MFLVHELNIVSCNSATTATLSHHSHISATTQASILYDDHNHVSWRLTMARLYVLPKRNLAADRTGLDVAKPACPCTSAVKTNVLCSSG